MVEMREADLPPTSDCPSTYLQARSSKKLLKHSLSLAFSCCYSEEEPQKSNSQLPVTADKETQEETSKFWEWDGARRIGEQNERTTLSLGCDGRILKQKRGK